MAADKGPGVAKATYALLVLTTVAVALRFWGRYVAKKAGFWWDDWLALLALVFYWGTAALTLWWVHVGLGKHITQIPPKFQSKVALGFFIDNLVYNTGISIIKLSVLMFYVRIFYKVRIYRIAFWVTGVLIVGWFIALNFMALFICVPVQAQWLPDVPGHCLPSHATFLGTTVSNIIIDFIILILPMPMLWKLRIDFERKVVLIGIFAAGYCTVILSILRLVSVEQVGSRLRLDISWNIAHPQLLVVCEQGVALISCCLPTILNLAKFGIRKYLPTIGQKLAPSEPLNGPGGTNIGPTGSPMNIHKDKTFVKLQNLDSKRSQERLFQGSTPGHHFANITSEEHVEDQTIDYSESGFEGQQIHVRKDIDVEAGSGTAIHR